MVVSSCRQSLKKCVSTNTEKVTLFFGSSLSETCLMSSKNCYLDCHAMSTMQLN